DPTCTTTANDLYLTANATQPGYGGRSRVALVAGAGPAGARTASSLHGRHGNGVRLGGATGRLSGTGCSDSADLPVHATARHSAPDAWLRRGRRSRRPTLLRRAASRQRATSASRAPTTVSRSSCRRSRLRSGT